MSGEENYGKALGELRKAMTGFKPGQPIYDQIVASREQVLARYGPIFRPDHIPNLTRDEFTSFLYFENNRHWSHLYRRGLGAAEDMDQLRNALGLLLDEGRPIAERFTEAVGMVTGMGKGLATAVLTVAYADKYGVWNNTSEGAFKQLGLWPNVERGRGIGGKYERMNALLLRLSSDLNTDLWMLDALWWFLKDGNKGAVPGVERAEEVIPGAQTFGLEQHLEEFLLENWERTELGKEWAILTTPEDPEAGNQYPTEVGPIDILAKHKSHPRYLVVELKRNQSTDQSVAQALRYVGWVKKHLAKQGESVEALIIGHKVKKDAQYAILSLPNFRLMEYEVEFRLKPIEPLP